jgi:hypothetical protein
MAGITGSWQNVHGYERPIDDMKNLPTDSSENAVLVRGSGR